MSRSARIALAAVRTSLWRRCGARAGGQARHRPRGERPRKSPAGTIDVRPDGQGLPPGKGTVAEGEEIFQAQCAACHGEFGEGKDRWPVLAGGHRHASRTTGRTRPSARSGRMPSTVFDYMRRAMPFGNAQSLSNDEIYAVTAYLLYLNDVIKDTSFELNRAEFYLDQDAQRRRLLRRRPRDHGKALLEPESRA